MPRSEQQGGRGQNPRGRVGRGRGGRGGSARGGSGRRQVRPMRRNIRSHVATGDWACLACQFKNSQFLPYCEHCSVQRGESPYTAASTATTPAEVGTVRQLVLENKPVHAHLMALKEPESYIAGLRTLIDRKVTLTSAAKGRVLAALWSARQFEEVDRLLNTPGLYAVADVLRACNILDAARLARQLRAKIARCAELGRGVGAKLKQAISRAQQAELEACPTGSLTRAFTKRIRSWVQRIPAETLEFWLLGLPTDPWRQLADLIHFRDDDFKLPYFLSVVFGGAAPADTLCAATKDLTHASLASTIQSFPQLAEQYSYVRTRLGAAELTDDAKLALLQSMPLSDAIWFYHELHCHRGAAMMQKRLDTGEALGANTRANFGKLMERILAFKQSKYAFADLLMPYAEEALSGIRESSGGDRKFNVAVFGDASGSMQVAINSAAILGGLLSVCLNAELSFFNIETRLAPCQPRSAADVLSIAETCRANGGTTPAASLVPYLESRRPVDLFIVVTDEEENGTVSGKNFAQLFKEYRTKVHAGAQVMFVSFLHPGATRGRMQVSLQSLGISSTCFVLDKRMPDLTKFDALLGLVTLHADEGVDDTAATATAAGGGGDGGGHADTQAPVPLPGVTAAGTAVAQTETATLAQRLQALELENARLRALTGVADASTASAALTATTATPAGHQVSDGPE